MEIKLEWLLISLNLLKVFAVVIKQLQILFENNNSIDLRRVCNSERAYCLIRPWIIVNTTFYRFLCLIICNLGAVADPTKVGYIIAAIDFLISNLLLVRQKIPSRNLLAPWKKNVKQPFTGLHQTIWLLIPTNFKQFLLRWLAWLT